MGIPSSNLYREMGMQALLARADEVIEYIRSMIAMGHQCRFECAPGMSAIAPIATK
jgi:hypothetical protein